MMGRYAEQRRGGGDAGRAFGRVFLRSSACAFGIAVLIAGCAREPERKPGPPPAPDIIGGPDILDIGERPPDIGDIEISIRRKPDGRKDPDGASALRIAAISQAAQEWGAQAGMALRSHDILSYLQDRSPHLSRAFDFHRVAAGAPGDAGWILPPVVTRSFDAFEMSEDGKAATTAEEYLSVAAAGRIVPVIPSWRDWLLFSAPQPEKAPESLMPVSKDELDVFSLQFEAGWQAGLAQAEDEFRLRVNRLVRDFEGMLQYRRLVALGMVRRMSIADASGAARVSGKTMRIGERTVRIVEEAEFEADPERWRPVAVLPQDRAPVSEGSILAGLEERLGGWTQR